MANQKVVILGAKGMLGTDLAAECRRRGFDVSSYDLPEFDITRQSDVETALKGAKLAVNCAAYTNVDKAESEPDLACKINAEAVGKLGTVAKKAGIWLLHISTDFVFDGKSSKPYTETDKPNPINTYGKSKLAGEQLLIESGCRHCIIRLEWTYGRAGNNFVTKLVTLAKEGRSLKVVDDQVGSPTATTETAKAICVLLKKQPQGLFHYASTGYASRYEMARFVFDRLNMAVNLSACKSSEYKSAAARPLNSCFDCGKIQAVLGEPIRPWHQPLEEFLRQL
jgi:dTDP-4-dehydrorhamnose reductase